ncbi:MAG: DinB family protein [Acidimicrobiia bacterium]
MKTTWIESLEHRYENTLQRMESALRDCPDELWEASMWKVPPLPPGKGPLPGPDGKVNDDPEVQERLLQGASAVWAIAFHALWFVDYDLAGGFVEWEPPAPFGKNDQAAFVVTRTWTRSELLDYVGYCKKRAQQTLGALAEEQAATPLPSTHRYAGRPFSWLLIGILLHLTEHASQIRQFITSAADSIQGTPT